MVLLMMLFACSSAPAECPECPPCEAAASGGEALSAFEAALLREDLDDLRQGVRPFGEAGFGVCQGARECERFLGPSPGELPPGDYIVTAELSVPKLGEGWQIEFAMRCETTNEKGETSTSEDSKVYTVSYAGADRGYRLARLRTVESPNARGKRACDYSMTPIRPGGERGEALKGSFSVPAG